MGYNTIYSLAIDVPEDPTPDEVVLGANDANAIVAILRQEIEDAEYAIDEEGGWDNEIKWYDHTEDMKEFSKRFPRCLFQLECEGEDGEKWTEYFKNGKYAMIQPIIIWPEFDESLLK